MKVFLSLGMSGKSENEIRRNIDLMKSMGHYIFNNLKDDDDIVFIHNADYAAPADRLLIKNPALYYLGEAIKKMGDADAVLFWVDYRRHKGCLVEEECARQYNIDRYYIEIKEEVKGNADE